MAGIADRAAPARRHRQGDAGREEAGRARQRSEQADARGREAEADLRAARDQVQRDAVDLRLPPEAERLQAVEQALERFDEAQGQLVQAVREWQRAWPEHLEQQLREDDARATLEQVEGSLALAEDLAGQARSVSKPCSNPSASRSTNCGAN